MKNKECEPGMGDMAWRSEKKTAPKKKSKKAKKMQAKAEIGAKEKYWKGTGFKMP